MTTFENQNGDENLFVFLGAVFVFGRISFEFREMLWQMRS